ncbi:MAG TPA: alpha/beta hydrolase [Bacteroidia bacterium]|nr:alpha/beta hydrolase [Bacteroidia bacterium]
MERTLLMLHGAIGASDQLERLSGEFSGAYGEVLFFDFPGHGCKAAEDAEFSIPYFANALLAWMEEKNVVQPDVFGYSMGGYVALYIASHFPGKLGKIVTLGTKFSWSGETALKEVKMLDPEKIKEKVPAFAAALEKRHSPGDWKTVLSKTTGMMLELGRDPALKKQDFLRIATPVLLTVGGKDTMVGREETEEVHRLVAGSQLHVFRDTPHPVEMIDAALVSREALNFFR